MKVIKRGLFIPIFIITLFIININVKAYDLFENQGTIYTEKELLDEFLQFEDFDKEKFTNFYCRFNYSTPHCYSFTNEQVTNFQYKSNTSKFVTTSVSNGDCYYFHLQFSSTYINRNKLSCMSSFELNPEKTMFSNFNSHLLTDEENKIINLLNFNFDEIEEIPEPEINTKATNLLNFLIDKAKNIYELLINNDIFKFILSIPLIYLCFLVLSRIIKK